MELETTANSVVTATRRHHLIIGLIYALISIFERKTKYGKKIILQTNLHSYITIEKLNKLEGAYCDNLSQDAFQVERLRTSMLTRKDHESHIHFLFTA